jgi:hypothetical protein
MHPLIYPLYQSYTSAGISNTLARATLEWYVVRTRASIGAEHLRKGSDMGKTLSNIPWQRSVAAAQASRPATIPTLAMRWKRLAEVGA